MRNSDRVLLLILCGVSMLATSAGAEVIAGADPLSWIRLKKCLLSSEPRP